MDKIRILQLGKEDWSRIYILPDMAEFTYAENFVASSKKAYDIVFLDRTPLEEEIEPLYQVTKAYTMFVTENVEICSRVAWLCNSRKAKRLATDDIQRFLLQEVRYYYPKSYGEKFSPRDMAIAQGFTGSVKWNGNCSVILTGEFGDVFRQAVFWRYNIPVMEGRKTDLWLEYRKEANVDISLVVTQFARGNISDIINQWEFNEKELDQIVQIDNWSGNVNLFVSLRARGRGELQIIALHSRVSRGNHGYFIPGGERYVTSDRQEIFCYFEPADMKPPLNVFFSGWKTRQGFEGYDLMKGMECPFLLLSESRLESGCSYVGSEEYEKLLVSILKKYMTELRFTSNQVILSGISGGAYGALYYGCDISPYAMIAGKPVSSLGNVAANEKYLRAGSFPPPLDMLLYLCNATDTIAVKKLNDRFWNKFDAANWEKSKFIISYMIEDDYDSDAYDTLISHLRSGGVQVYGKGIHGRHNDNTLTIMNWFSSQFKKILREDFLRRIAK